MLVLHVAPLQLLLRDLEGEFEWTKQLKSKVMRDPLLKKKWVDAGRVEKATIADASFKQNTVVKCFLLAVFWCTFGDLYGGFFNTTGIADHSIDDEFGSHFHRNSTPEDDWVKQNMQQFEAKLNLAADALDGRIRHLRALMQGALAEV